MPKKIAYDKQVFKNDSVGTMSDKEREQRYGLTGRKKAHHVVPTYDSSESRTRKRSRATAAKTTMMAVDYVSREKALLLVIRFLTTSDIVSAQLVSRSNVWGEMKEIFIANACMVHKEHREKIMGVKLKTLKKCPLCNWVCNACEDVMNEEGGSGECSKCDAFVCAECTGNSWCDKCEAYVCMNCSRVSYCEHCDTSVCRCFCGYDFCETCMQVVCSDCGNVTWLLSGPPYSICTFCGADP